ncbi:MAG: hypothetical protein DRP84_08240 [Spirochaetes bacterium]|nr:MAG: hypothetical protein DRP84_08240 [Spirochaetota bacterium]
MSNTYLGTKDSKNKKANRNKNIARQLMDILDNKEIPDAVNNKETIKSLLDDPLDLPLSSRMIFFTLVREGPSNLDTISKEVNLRKNEIKKVLEGLIRKKLIGEKNGRYYVIAYSWCQDIFPSGPYIPLIYHYNLLCDSNRVDAFSKAISEKVGKNDVVVDLGAGVGILSILAAKNAKKVYAVDFDFEVVQTGKAIVKSLGYEDKIEYILDDAREVTLPEKVDVIICEMMDTGLISELQVPVMNRALDFIGKGNSKKIIPLKAVSSLQFVYSDYLFYDFSFKLPHFEAYGSRTAEKVISKEEIYDVTYFNKKNEIYLDKKITTEAITSGKVNGIRIKTYVETCDGITAGQSSWFNPPLVLPLSRDYYVSKGDLMIAYISYEFGGGLKNLHWRAVI